MDNIKQLVKNEKKQTWDLDTNNTNMLPGNRNRIRYRKMCHADNERCEKTNNGRNRSAKSGKNQNAWREGNFQALENIVSGHHQTIWDGRKTIKGHIRRTAKLLETKLSGKNLIKDVNTCAVPFVRFSGSFLMWTMKLITIRPYIKKLHWQIWFGLVRFGFIAHQPL